MIGPPPIKGPFTPITRQITLAYLVWIITMVPLLIPQPLTADSSNTGKKDADMIVRRVREVKANQERGQGTNEMKN